VIIVSLIERSASFVAQEMEQHLTDECMYSPIGKIATQPN